MAPALMLFSGIVFNMPLYGVTCFVPCVPPHHFLNSRNSSTANLKLPFVFMSTIQKKLDNDMSDQGMKNSAMEMLSEVLYIL